ncbi:FkbM family methyltransferase [Sphingomonas asaccharolytica]|uniref:FkbM family methyltransferase n=1 Tax=Sphingomonas asaccharolytica TaxID=40681 RepID=UPI00083133A2|nr:FkbM family methyltransferase [Sphingomonas asaccharolytica]
MNNGKTRMAGDLSSFIDRQVFLFGGYERDQISQFVRAAPRHTTVLDVGANVGNHSIEFSRAFDKVHAFEPNPVLWPAFERNVALNPDADIELHRIGLSDTMAELPLLNIDNGNLGLATFLDVDQYERPLREVARARVERADDYLGEIAVDAVKIDVQGFEPQVLRGMPKLLERCRPVVWAEFSSGTISQTYGDRALIEELFPYPVALSRFEVEERAISRRIILVPYGSREIEQGDYVISPADS